MQMLVQATECCFGVTHLGSPLELSVPSSLSTALLCCICLSTFLLLLFFLTPLRPSAPPFPDLFVFKDGP